MTDLCDKSPGNISIVLIPEKTSAFIVAKKNKNNFKSCQLGLGLNSTDSSARIQLQFEFLYIEDCLIHLQINESSTTDFKNSRDNREMLMIKCNSRNPGPLFARPKNFVLLNLIKDTMSTDAVNFYLNITMAGDPPTTGLELHIVIIIGFVAFIVVIVAGCLLLKYISRLSERMHEQRVEAAMTRAINIYNSHEPLEEPDMVLIRPGDIHLARPQHRAASIAFVHSDGRIERFCPLENENCEHSETRVQLPSPQKSSEHSRRHLRHMENDYVDCCISHGTNVHNNSPALQLVTSHRSTSQGHSNDHVDAISIGGIDMPPTYEEALEMPGPSALLLSDHEVNSTIEVQNVADAGDREESHLDYMNVGLNLSHSESYDVDHSDSGEALLPKIGAHRPK
ncbi:hypothetical protein Btru_038006 [Bulinus truncatus]|nr:hypothetical protein Btru_038006 [Bulinus truncatus]